MSRVHGSHTPRTPRFPRVSGDEPDAGYAAETAEAFSPRERG